MTEKKTVVLTGVKPTGQPHIGNYLGAMRPAVEFSQQPNIETWLFVADYHAITTTPDPKELREATYEVAATWLACGLDPVKNVLYRQSDIPEILELNWILSCLTPKGYMNRAHAYKARVQENQAAGKKDDDLDFGVNMGLFGYPVLMTADILMFNADKVPVGEDQAQHLEFARDIAQKFNRQYGEVLKVPATIITKVGKSVPGLDGRKMSKSYSNTIPMFEESARLRKLVMKIKSDSLPPEAPKPIEGSILFEMFEAFASSAQIEDMRAKFTNGISWGVVKEELFQVMDEVLKGPREKFKALMGDREYLEKLLTEGRDKARPRAAENLKKVRKAIGIE